MKPLQLRAGSLSFVEVLAASMALIGMSMTPVLIAPYVFGAAGNATWLAYVFAGVMLLLVAVNLNQFARRSTSAGSMFVYAAKELGPALGAMMGFGLIWSYVFVGAANFGAQALFLGNIIGALNLRVPTVETALVAMVALGAICWLLSVRDIALSTIVMLVLESISVAIICVIIVIVLVRHPHVDAAQLHLNGVSKAGIGIGIATAIFSFVGFESATAFGAEAKNPLKNIPRAVIWSVIIASIFFVFALYAEILGLRGSKPPLDQLSAPLWSLADALNVSYLKVPITIGAICSSFSVALACVNTGARVALPMAQDGLLPRQLGAIHPRFATPYIALALTIVTMFLIAVGMFAMRVRPIDIFNFCGVLSALSFIFVYLLIAVAASMYLHRVGELRPIDVGVSALTCLFLTGASVTLFYPTPAPPDNLFPYLFGIYLIACYVIYLASRRVSLGET
jgi:amino acid transporter